MNLLGHPTQDRVLRCIALLYIPLLVAGSLVYGLGLWAHVALGMLGATWRRRQHLAGASVPRAHVSEQASAGPRSGRMDADDDVTYEGFISYSHKLDDKLAPALQAELERFGKPWYRQRVRRVFRDNANLAASPQLWEAISSALQASRWFILLASPNAAASKWVRREVDWWLANRSIDRIVIALTDGELVWDANTGKADPERALSLPPALISAMTGEPRWVDLRWIRHEHHIDQANPRFRDCIADIAAAVSEVPKDTLVGEHVKRHRQTVRLVRLVIVTLSLLLIAALVGGLIAVVQRDVAIKNQRIATARQLVAEADASRDSNPQIALQLGIAAQQIHRSPETQASLVYTMTSSRYLRTLPDHDSVTSVAFANNGRTLATASDEVTLWDLSGRLQPRTLDQPDVEAMALTPDGRTMAVSSSSTLGSSTLLWDLSDPAQPHQIGAPLPSASGLPSLAFAPDGRTLATGSAADSVVVLWDLTDRARPRRLSRSDSPSVGVRSMVYAPDGHTLAVSGEKVALWDVSRRTHPALLGRPLGLHRGYVESTAFSSDGRRLATGGNDWTVTVWDVSRLDAPVPIQRLTAFRQTVWSVAFSPSGRTLATASDRIVSLWDLSDAQETREFDASLTVHTDRVAAMAFSPDGQVLATGSDDRTVTLWDMSDRYQPRRLGQPVTGRSGPVTAMAFTPDGRILAAGGADGMVVLLDVSIRTKPRQIGQPLKGHTTWVRTVAFSPDGRTLVSTDLSGNAILWNVANPAEPHRLGNLGPEGDPISSVSFAGDGRTLATGGDGAIVLWDMRDRAHPRANGHFQTGHSEVDALAFAPDGKTLAIGNSDKTVVVLDMSTGEPGRRLGQPLVGYNFDVRFASFDENGRILATADSGGGVILWDVTDRTRPRRLVPPTSEEPQGNLIAFDSHGDTVAIAESSDVPRTMTLWSLTDPTEPRRLGHPITGQVVAPESGAFSRDGRTLATADFDGSFMLWDLTRLSEMRSDPVKDACSRAGGSLDPVQWRRYATNLPYQDGCAGRDGSP